MSKSTLPLLTKLTLTLLLCSALIAWAGWSGILRHLPSRENLPATLIALTLALLFTLLKSLKWWLMLHQQEPSISWRTAGRSYLVGMAGGLLTPGRVGELSRALTLGQIERASVVALTLLDRFLDLWVVALLALPGLARFSGRGPSWLLPLLALLGLPLLILSKTPPAGPLAWLHRRSAAKGGVVKKLLSAGEAIFRIPRRHLLCWLGLSGLGYAVVLLEFHWLLGGPSQYSFHTILLCLPLIMLANILPFTLSGLGVREGLSAALLATFDVPAGLAISAAFQLFLFNTALPALAGGAWLLCSPSALRKQAGPRNRHPDPAGHLQKQPPGLRNGPQPAEDSGTPALPGEPPLCPPPA